MPREMRLVAATAAVALMLGTVGGHAENELKPPAQTAAEPSKADETLKERLSDKASDEQRVDNCKVPLDRRGSTPRPEGCKPDEARASPALKQP
jgi:hypothetical protein